MHDVKIFFLVTGLLLNASILRAQNEIKISGTVIEDSTLQAIPFVTLSIKGTATLTDLNGKFNFTTPANASDSVVFSCIGYESKIIPVRSFLSGKEQIVKLLPKVYELQGPDIPGLSSKEIVKRATKRIPEIFRADTFYESAFYRQYHEENSKYVRLIEAAITIENRVTKNTTSLKSDEWVSVNHIRRSDNLEQNMEEHGDHLFDLFKENPVYHAEGTVLNQKALDLYRFYFDTTHAFPDSVYHIFYYSTDRTRDRFDRGEIFIDADDFSVRKITKEEIKNAPVRMENHSSPRYYWDFISSKTVAEYKMKNRKMHTVSLMKTYTHELYDSRVHTMEFVVKEYFELTMQNEIKPEPMIQKYFSEFANLYHRKYFYNASFWQDYNTPPFFFCKPEVVKSNLEKNKNLEEQFLSNGFR